MKLFGKDSDKFNRKNNDSQWKRERPESRRYVPVSFVATDVSKNKGQNREGKSYCNITRKVCWARTNPKRFPKG